MNKLTKIGLYIWLPIFLFSFTDTGKSIFNNMEYINFAIGILIAMTIGTAIFLIGLFKNSGL